jgi:hypothetical protein
MITKFRRFGEQYRGGVKDLPKVRGGIPRRDLQIRRADIRYLKRMGWDENGVRAQNHFRDIILARSGDQGAIRRLKALSGIISKDRLHKRMPRLVVRRGGVIEKPRARMAIPREIQDFVPEKFLKLFSSFEEVRVLISSVSRLVAYCFGEGLFTIDGNSLVSNRSEELKLREMLKRYRGVHEVMEVTAGCRIERVTRERASVIINLQIQPRFYSGRHPLLGHSWSLSESMKVGF